MSLLRRIIDKLLQTFSQEKISDFVFDVSLSGQKIGLNTAQKDLKMENELEPDEDTLRSIGLRANVISEGTVSQAKGSLAHNSAKLQEEIDAKIQAGVSESEALASIENRVMELFEESFPKWKLERLVRDQFLTSVKEGRREGWQRGGVQYRKWQATKDNKTASDSLRMHNQIKPVDEPYVDPKTGEKYMIPHMRPNDRCYEIPLFELPQNTYKKGGQLYDRD